MDKVALGYIVCKTCLTPKAIYQGSGKRSKYVYARCQCGMDNRCGKAIQAQFKAFKSLDEITAEIESLKQPVVIDNNSESNPLPIVNNEPESTPIEPKPEPQSQPQPKPNKTEPQGVSTATCIGLGALMGVVFGGFVKAMKVVA